MLIHELDDALIGLAHDLDDALLDLAKAKRNARVAREYLSDALHALRSNKPHITEDLIDRALAELEDIK